MKRVIVLGVTMAILMVDRCCAELSKQALSQALQVHIYQARQDLQLEQENLKSLEREKRVIETKIVACKKLIQQFENIEKTTGKSQKRNIDRKQKELQDLENKREEIERGIVACRHSIDVIQRLIRQLEQEKTRMESETLEEVIARMGQTGQGDYFYGADLGTAMTRVYYRRW